MTRIETERLILRTPAETDLAAYLAYRNDPVALAAQRMPVLEEREARLFLRAQADMPKDVAGWHMLGIEEKTLENGTLIGEVGVFLHPEMLEGNVGWWLHRQRTGRGLATEAARALLDWCFSMRRLHRVTAGCLSDNTNSFHLMQRLGMRLETRSIESRKLGDAWYDEYGFALLSREWAFLKSPSHQD